MVMASEKGAPKRTTWKTWGSEWPQKLTAGSLQTLNPKLETKTDDEDTDKALTRSSYEGFKFCIQKRRLVARINSDQVSSNTDVTTSSYEGFKFYI